MGCLCSPPDPDCLQCVHTVNQTLRTRNAELEKELERVRGQRDELIPMVENCSECDPERGVCPCGLERIRQEIAQEQAQETKEQG